MANKHIAAIASMIAILAAAGTGCGGSSHATSSDAGGSQAGNSHGAMSQAELIAKANSICKRFQAERQALSLRTRQDFVPVMTKWAAYDERAYTELGELKPPASLAPEWRVFVTRGQQLTRDTRQLVHYAMTYNVRAARRLDGTIADTLDLMRVTAKRYGFLECARGA